MVCAAALASGWAEMLEEAVPSVVMIRSYSPTSFEGKQAGVSSATGFVVDAERGIILTNRHVVRTGPIVAQAVFQNNEEINLVPIYRDPVHDFGFFRYEPAHLEHADPRALELRPEHAVQGAEVRLVGSDAGEKVSILSGTLAWLDRAAPNYGSAGYNDFNTFYIQAASGSSGGSSGSPVLDLHGHVVALNAGSKRRAASSFFLPLPRVVRALGHIQRGEDVPRGTLHTTFIRQTFDEARRLGLPHGIEEKMRAAAPDAKGALVVDRVLNGSPSAESLSPGEILFTVGGDVVVDFLGLESRLDASVGEEVELVVISNGKEQVRRIRVSDLHEITPSRFIEFGGGVFHDLGYQAARHTSLPLRGIRVSSRGYVFGDVMPRGAIITHVNGQSVERLSAFKAVIETIPDRAFFGVEVVTPTEPERPLVYSARMDRRWFRARECQRVDGQRDWACTLLSPAPERPAREGRSVQPMKASGRVAKKLGSGLVMVHHKIPYRTDGVYAGSFSGVGVVVDRDRGLVLTDRDTITTGLGDTTVVFAESLEVEAEVVALHPLINLALVRYNPTDIAESVVEEIRFSDEPIKAGQRLLHVGFEAGRGLSQAKVKAQSVRPVTMPVPRVPFFRQANLPVVETRGGEDFFGGVLTTRTGRPVALVGSFPNLVDDAAGNIWRGILGGDIRRFLDDYTGSLSIGVEWSPIPLVEALSRGLPRSWSERIERKSRARREVLRVSRITRGGSADGHVQPGDLLLAVDGTVVTDVSDMPKLRPGQGVTLTLLRGASEVNVDLTPSTISTSPFRRVVLWGGVLLQEPHLALAAQRYQPPEGAYISYYWSGSPAGRFGLRPLTRIVEVDGQPVLNLGDFSEGVRGKQHGEPVRLLVVDLKGRERMVTMEADPSWWPLVEIGHTEEGWVRRIVQEAVEDDRGSHGGDDG